MDRRYDDRNLDNFQPMVLRLLDTAPSYDPRARQDDEQCTNETSLVAATQPGGTPLLHSKWQEEGYVDRLSRGECSALARAGYRIQKDGDGHWTWWREKRLNHLWLTVHESGWMSTSSSHVQGAVKWKLLGSFSDPIIPYFDGYQITTMSLIREALTTTILALKEFVPDRVMSAQFFSVVRDLCAEANNNLDIDGDWLSKRTY